MHLHVRCTTHFIILLQILNATQCAFVLNLVYVIQYLHILVWVVAIIQIGSLPCIMKNDDVPDTLGIALYAINILGFGIHLK